MFNAKCTAIILYYILVLTLVNQVFVDLTVRPGAFHSIARYGGMLESRDIVHYSIQIQSFMYIWVDILFLFWNNCKFFFLFDPIFSSQYLTLSITWLLPSRQDKVKLTNTYRLLRFINQLPYLCKLLFYLILHTQAHRHRQLTWLFAYFGNTVTIKLTKVNYIKSKSNWN